MAPPKVEIQRLEKEGNAARLEYFRTGDAKALFRMIAAYAEAHLLARGESKQSPMDPLINTAGRNADRAASALNDLQRELERAGDNPPPGLLAKIQLATQEYQAWFTCLKSCADSKGQIQGELARFR